ncbi:hypothetical protein TNCV_2654761 [Trichonephila clavipes]|nr:hypothetical protein TNCV_2654761 [Trichonephila clavipes]
MHDCNDREGTLKISFAGKGATENRRVERCVKSNVPRMGWSSQGSSTSLDHGSKGRGVSLIVLLYWATLMNTPSHSRCENFIEEYFVDSKGTDLYQEVGKPIDENSACVEVGKPIDENPACVEVGTNSV